MATPKSTRKSVKKLMMPIMDKTVPTMPKDQVMMERFTFLLNRALIMVARPKPEEYRLMSLSLHGRGHNNNHAQNARSCHHDVNHVVGAGCVRQQHGNKVHTQFAQEGANQGHPEHLGAVFQITRVVGRANRPGNKAARHHGNRRAERHFRAGNAELSRSGRLLL